MKKWICCVKRDWEFLNFVHLGCLPQSLEKSEEEFCWSCDGLCWLKGTESRKGMKNAYLEFPINQLNIQYTNEINIMQQLWVWTFFFHVPARGMAGCIIYFLCLKWNKIGTSLCQSQFVLFTNSQRCRFASELFSLSLSLSQSESKNIAFVPLSNTPFI